MLVIKYESYLMQNYYVHLQMKIDNVAISVDQFYTIREAISATIQLDQEKN